MRLNATLPMRLFQTLRAPPPSRALIRASFRYGLGASGGNWPRPSRSARSPRSRRKPFWPPSTPRWLSPAFRLVELVRSRPVTTCGTHARREAISAWPTRLLVLSRSPARIGRRYGSDRAPRAAPTRRGDSRHPREIARASCKPSARCEGAL